MTLRHALFCFLMSVSVVTAATADDKNTIHVAIGDVRASSDLRPVDGITSSGQPDTTAFAVVAESGYVAFIDMRGPEEDRGLDEQVVVEELGMEYIAFPLANRASISMQNAQRLDELLSGIDGPVLLHCGSGNRVGAMLAMRHSLRGADIEAALDYGRSAGLTGLEPLVKKQLQND